jgi:GTPase SAR1 family protein
LRALERQSALLRAAGGIAALKSELDRFCARLEAVPLWMPAAGLKRQCAEALRWIEAIEARLERSLVVTVIGPSGAGKSTLVNALCGGAELSRSGRERPTTGGLIVFGAPGEEAAGLGRELEAEFVAIPRGSADLPERLYLVDTPDTDSVARERHLPALERAVRYADILICVFDAENPKRRDHADYLAPVVRRFDGSSLVAVLNKCDRLDENELKNTILPDFLAYVQDAWRGAVDRALCTSARTHVAAPGWDAAAAPRHSFDQFAELNAIVRGAAGPGGLVFDRRVENVRRLTRWVLEEAGRELAADADALAAASRRMAEIDRAALSAAAGAFKGDGARWSSGAGASFYQKIAQRWIGPVGWLMALWARLLSIGGGIAHFFRPGRGWFSRDRRGSEESGGGREGRGGHAAERPEGLLQRYRLAYLRAWPEAAEMLVAGRFDPEVRRGEAAGAAAERFAAGLTSLWADAVEAEADRRVRGLTGLALQLLVNAPVVGVLGHVGWTTVTRYLEERYLPGDFFVHALWVIVIVLLLSFMALQLVIRLAGSPERLSASAFARLEPQLIELDARDENPVRRQVEAVLELSGRRPPSP